MEGILELGIDNDSYIYETLKPEPVKISDTRPGILGVGVVDVGMCNDIYVWCKKTGFRNEMVDAWLLANVSMSSSDKLECRWYRNFMTSPGVDNWQWLVTGTWYGPLSGQYYFDNYDTIGGTSQWCSKRPSIWKCEWYFNGAYLTGVQWYIYVIQGDIIIVETTIKHTGTIRATLRNFSRYWGPSSSEQWGASSLVQADIDPGNIWIANNSYTIPATMRNGAWINIDTVVTDVDGNVLAQTTRYSIITKA